jgi:hypothetical protein
MPVEKGTKDTIVSKPGKNASLIFGPFEGVVTRQPHLYQKVSLFPGAAVTSIGEFRHITSGS